LDACPFPNGKKSDTGEDEGMSDDTSLGIISSIVSRHSHSVWLWKTNRSADEKDFPFGPIEMVCRRKIKQIEVG